MNFAEALKQAKGSIIKARRLYMSARKWSAEDWYVAWQAGELAREVHEVVGLDQKNYLIVLEDDRTIIARKGAIAHCDGI